MRVRCGAGWWDLSGREVADTWGRSIGDILAIFGPSARDVVVGGRWVRHYRLGGRGLSISGLYFLNAQGMNTNIKKSKIYGYIENMNFIVHNCSINNTKKR